MNEVTNSAAAPAEHALPAEDARVRPGAPVAGLERERDAALDRRWWIKLFVAPLIWLACGALLIVGLGVAQRSGFLSAGGGGHHSAQAGGEATRFICPMMCTPPQSEPGRCPVCAMELVPATSQSANADGRSVAIDPVARRVANIRTVAVESRPITRTIRTVGELAYDEGGLKTISAYVDGRVERLYADYTGVVVQKDDHLALVYSPQLYASQVEFLLARNALEAGSAATLKSVVRSNSDLYESAKQRIIELGMTEAQVKELEQQGKANSRLHLCAPISGTVIEKFAVEGEYVKQGEPIYKLADLSVVWLMLELFPEDAATIRYGQKVQAEMQSLPGRTFAGRVAFIDPTVDPNTRTVGVRVVIPNRDGLLRIGDFAKAAIDVPLQGSAGEPYGAYDPELADKWISPRHPHIVADSAGACPICGVDLVPAARFGFMNEPAADGEVLVIPRSAVLMAGRHSVVYVETEPGRFELRQVVLGPKCGESIVVQSGVNAGEEVAVRGNFLIDSQMQLAGNPSLLDPTRAGPMPDKPFLEEAMAELSKLPADERQIAESQRLCPVTMMPLGSMGPPQKVDVDGNTVFICCGGCRESLLEEPKKYLAILAAMHDSDGSLPELPEMELPPIGDPELIEPESNLPPIEDPQPLIDGEREMGPAGQHSVHEMAGESQEARQ